ncbi:MAG: hypothetical protein FWC41_00340 [Firmicutes bacterium]|nr:hypothetical protein [Bacillota bacterium]
MEEVLSHTLHTLHCSFKVDHYLGEDYDRKLTEVFLSSINFKLFSETVELMESLLQNLDNKIIINDFVVRYGKNTSSANLIVSYAKETLKTAIDELYNGKNKKDTFKGLKKFISLNIF